MPCMLDLPDELLLKIIAWVPYRPGSHHQLSLVCRHFQSLTGVKALSGMIAWYQFAPFMRLLEGYRGRSTTEYSSAELVQTWKSIIMHRDWLAFLRETTGLNTEICLTAVCIVHFIAASYKKVLESRGPSGDHSVRSLVFFGKVVQNLPVYGVMLLRYIINITLEDVNERQMPYDRLHYLRILSSVELDDDRRKANLFMLDCVSTHTFALLDGYVPLYNLLADPRLHQGFVGTNSSKAVAMLRCFPQPPADWADTEDADFLLGYFALHTRLIRTMKENGSLSSIDGTVDTGWDVWKRMSFEYKRMQRIDNELGRMFANMRSTPNEIRELDLEGIGRFLKDLTTKLQTMSQGDVARLGEQHREAYKLDRWG